MKNERGSSPVAYFIRVTLKLCLRISYRERFQTVSHYCVKILTILYITNFVVLG